VAALLSEQLAGATARIDLAFGRRAAAMRVASGAASSGLRADFNAPTTVTL